MSSDNAYREEGRDERLERVLQILLERVDSLEAIDMQALVRRYPELKAELLAFCREGLRRRQD